MGKTLQKNSHCLDLLLSNDYLKQIYRTIYVYNYSNLESVIIICS
jgi:hypothetical protein